MPIYSVTPFTLQDFPGRSACVLWFGGCNFRCPYCHNPELVYKHGSPLKESGVLTFLEKRRGMLDGVVFSGGECTLTHGLGVWAEAIKNMGYEIKLDTNGSNAGLLNKFVEERLVDYIALDYKVPLRKMNKVGAQKYESNFIESVDLICKGCIGTEIRTTVHLDMMDEQDVNEIIRDLDDRKYSSTYYIQNFVHRENLGGLKKVKRLFDKTCIYEPDSFEVRYRNFG